MIGMTPRSLALFLAYAEDAPNWSGTPLVGGNVPNTAEDRGNLTHLKRLGLITTFYDEGSLWLDFTTKGKELARVHGFEID